jgi:hypothetical protein
MVYALNESTILLIIVRILQRTRDSEAARWDVTHPDFGGYFSADAIEGVCVVRVAKEAT